MTTSEVLNFTEMPIVDNGIEKFEFHEYEPINGQLVKADGAAYANTDVVALTNNGIMHLFSRITCELSNQDIEAVYYPAQGLNQLWYKDITTTAVLADNLGFALKQAYIIQKPTTKGTFSFCVPLRHIFGFCDDYDKVIYGLKHTISLVRQSDDDAIFKLAGVAAGKVNLNKISLFMLHVLPADAEKFKLYKQIESKVTLPVSFRARQCETIAVPQATSFSWRLSVKTSPENQRSIIVGFQTSKSGDQNGNPSIFDHCVLKNMYIMLNQERYPAVDYNLSFPNQQFSRAYREAAVFNEKFYVMNELITHCNIAPSDYKDLYPLMVFDVSKQIERLKSSTIDAQIKATFNSNVPANTQA
ncbi:uncharacterized protein LOC136081212 [Hydra vulgaris]|uniref:Uncharacterized protein LOC136081212 n=1 Tax=Hydra vulgaris TaxID=6087 RepID=A0ABM4BZA1_HYDVU